MVRRSKWLSLPGAIATAMSISALVVSWGVGGSAASTAAALPPVSLESPDLQVSEWAALPGDLVVLRFAPNGAAVVRKGASISRAAVPLDGELTAQAMRTSVPDQGIDAPALSTFGWTPTLIDRLATTVANGTPIPEAVLAIEPLRLAGVSPAAASSSPDDIVNANCIINDLPDAYSKGCFTTKRGTYSGGFLYRGDQFYALVDPEYNYESYTVTGGFTYGGSLVINSDPQSEIPSGSCGDVTLGFSFFGANFSESRVVCPDKISPTEREASMQTTWIGHTRGPQEHTLGVIGTKTVAGELREQHFSMSSVTKHEADPCGQKCDLGDGLLILVSNFIW